jgi:hypothetical protein
MLRHLPHSLLGIALFLCICELGRAADTPKVIDRLPTAEGGGLHWDRAFARRQPIVVPPPKGTPIRLPVTRDTLHPPPCRQLVEFRTPPRDPEHLPPRLAGE